MRSLGALLLAPLAAFAGIYGDLPDATHAWAVHDANRPRPPVVSLDAKGVPSDAVVLFDGTEASYRGNWRAMKGGGEAPWRFEDGEIVSHGGSIVTTRAFGDCQVHVEWRAPDDENPQHGNSGVYLMNLYEVQIINSHEIAPGRYHRIVRSGDEMAGSVYGQKPPLVNPLRRPGEWQVYDIVFHQPIRDSAGRIVHPGTLTVFVNGVLVQDDRAIEGPTDWKTRATDVAHADRAPLQLQDHNGNVRFRNIWLREIVSPWKEDLVSGTAACDPDAVRRLRRETAQKLLSELSGIADPHERLARALEMLSYCDEERFRLAAAPLAEAEADFLAHADGATRKRQVASLQKAFARMRKTGCLPVEWSLVKIVENSK